MDDSRIEDTRQPPDEPEATHCEDCGQDCTDGICRDPFCPSRHTGIAHDMAMEIVELREEVSRLKQKIKSITHRA